jgi:DNA-binding IclR family transcriptional regulator
VLAAERNQKWSEEVGLVTDGLQSVAACAFDHSGRPTRHWA